MLEWVIPEQNTPYHEIDYSTIYEESDFLDEQIETATDVHKFRDVCCKYTNRGKTITRKLVLKAIDLFHDWADQVKHGNEPFYNPPEDEDGDKLKEDSHTSKKRKSSSLPDNNPPPSQRPRIRDTNNFYLP